MKAPTIFGREPAAWVGLIEALVAVLVLLPVASALGINQQWAVLFMAVVSAAAGVFTAVATRDTALGAITGLVKAGIGLFAYYGLDASSEQQATILAATAVVVGFFQRTQTTPVANPVDPSPQQVSVQPTLAAGGYVFDPPSQVTFADSHDPRAHPQV